MPDEKTSPEAKPAEIPAPAVATPSDAKAEKPSVDKEAILTFVENMIDTLTFRRLALSALLILIGLVLFSLYENRTAIVNHYTQPQVIATDESPPASWTLSDGSKSQLVQLTHTTAVKMVMVTDVDLKKNRKLVRFYYINDDTIKLSQEELQAVALPQAVFDYDAKNTEQMVAILSNDFRCDPYKDTIYFRYAPELQDKIPTICRIAVPPFVGQFVGFLSVGIGKQLQPSDMDSVRLEVSRLAVDIYLHDVIKKPGSAASAASAAKARFLHLTN